MDFSLGHLLETMTPIALGVVAVLLLMSIWSVYVGIERILTYKKAKEQSLAFAKLATQKLAQDRLQEVVDAGTKFKFSHLARVTRAGLIEFLLDSKANPLSASEKVDAARRAIERETLVTNSDFKRGITGLATIATTAPFVGLFGTVIGIINAFAGMAKSGSGGIAAVSAGIAEALITTALGIGVAIIAAWIYNYFSTKLDRFQVEMSNSSSELLDFFVKRQGGSDAGRAHN